MRNSISKKLFAFALALLFLASLCPAALASSNVLRIRTAEELIELSRGCVLDEYSKNLTVVLESDIDLSGKAFSPIPLFGGHFIGNGHTISGFAFDGRLGSAGFIRTVLEGAVIEGLNLFGSVAPSRGASSVGGLAAVNRGVIRSCAFSGTVSGVESVGLIAGINAAEGVIEGCTAEGSAEGEHRVGGIVGENNGVVRDCENRAEVNANITEAGERRELEPDELLAGLSELRLSAEELIDITDIGGIAGMSSGVVRGCVNAGAVGHINIGYNIGGIVGHLSGFADGCENRGRVLGRKDVGGIVGQIDPYTEWSFSGGKLEELREKLNSLRDALSALTDGLGGISRELSSRLSAVFTALDAANSALDVLSGDAVDFVNSNIGTLNLLSERITEALSLLAPALAELSGFTDELPGVFERLSAAFDRLSEAAGISDEVMAGMAAEVGAITAELSGIRSDLDRMLALLEAYAAEPDPAQLGTLIAALSAALRDVNTRFGRIREASGRLLTVLTGLGEAGAPVSEALAILSEAGELLADALASLGRAVRMLAEAADTLSRYDALTFTPINGDLQARQALFASLGEAFAEFVQLSQYIGESPLSADLARVSEQFFDLIDFMLEGLKGFGFEEELIEDRSGGAALSENGTVSGCKNLGEISAETNAGGIAGAITLDFEFDLEDQFNISALVGGGVKYVVHSAVLDCSNAAYVSSRNSCAGGIIGRMDFGAVLRCTASGRILAGSDAGGIAGKSGGTLKSCMARARVEAESRCGGIAGTAHNIADCLALPELSGEASFCGAIAGAADGEIGNNYYSGPEYGGVDGASFSGRAERVEYAELLERSGNAELFKTVTVEFIKDSEIFSAVMLPYGGSISAPPTVDDADGRHWQWDAFEADNIQTDLRVEGRYVSPVYVLSSGEELPLVLVEGSFESSSSVAVTPFEPDLNALGIKPNRLLSASAVSVEGYENGLTVHLREAKNGVLYTEGADGAFRKTDYTRDGSYIVFPLANGARYVYAVSPRSVLPYILFGCAALAALALAVILSVRASRRKKARAK